MKLFSKLTATLLIASFAQLTYADTTIIADDHIKITAINGQTVNQGLFRSPTQSFTVGAGQAVISARYDRLFELNRNNHDVVKSAEITLIANLADNQTYRLTIPNLPQSYAAIKDFVKSPTLALMNGDTIIAQESRTQSKPLFGNLGGLFGKNSRNEHNQVIASLPNTQVTPTTIASQNTNDTLDNFMRLWLNADKTEREKIRNWVNEQQ